MPLGSLYEPCVDAATLPSMRTPDRLGGLLGDDLHCSRLHPIENPQDRQNPFEQCQKSVGLYSLWLHHFFGTQPIQLSKPGSSPGYQLAS